MLSSGSSIIVFFWFSYIMRHLLAGWQRKVCEMHDGRHGTSFSGAASNRSWLYEDSSLILLLFFQQRILFFAAVISSIYTLYLPIGGR